MPGRGFGGYPPARSALTLRLVLATFGLIVGLAAVVTSMALNLPVGLTIAFAAYCVLAAINLTVVAIRKGHGEPG